ncbi:hypothetical protein HDV00_004907 [Rhizophlyctis rosea]|nr:hypothetical protein HDV00_004907 [Rhizophlyctis rosea]
MTSIEAATTGPSDAKKVVVIGSVGCGKTALAILICFDLLNTSSFLELPYWYNEFKRNAPEALTILVGTKSDEADSIVVPLPDAMKQAKEWNMEFRAVSSKTGVNVQELFDHLIAHLP